MKTFIFMLPALLSFSVFADTKSYLTFSVTPPENALDWTTPGNFVKSMVKSRFLLEENPYGSVATSMYCMNLPTHEMEIAVAPATFDIVAPVVFQGQGLGYFYASHEGEFLEPLKVQSLAGKMTENPERKSVKFIISDQHCKRIDKFLSEFKTKKIAEKWGLAHRPLMGEGATSASLLAAIVKVAGLLPETELSKWEHTLYLPKKFSGSPLTDEYVSIFTLLGAEWGNHKNEDDFVLTFVDPVKVHEWIKEKTMTVDKSTSPVPQGNFWEQANDEIFVKKKKN